MLLYFDTLFFMLVFFAVIIYFIKYLYTFWSRQGIYQLQPSFPFGNTKSYILKTVYEGIVFQEIYNNFKSRNMEFGGFYVGLSPYFMPIDLELIRRMYVKDFRHFVDRGFVCNEKADVLTSHLLSLSGDRWRRMRGKLTPTFTSNKMKMMFNNLMVITERLYEVVDSEIMKNNPLNIKEILSRYTTDVIASCGFGIECNSLNNPDNLFRYYGEVVFNPKGINLLRLTIAAAFPRVATALNMRIFDKRVADFFLDLVKKTVKYRDDNKISRNDFLNTLMQLRKNSDNEDGLTLEEITAQCFLFFAAGFDTSSTTISWCLYELTQHEDIQENVREEINKVLKENDGRLSYDNLAEMVYMEQVIQETLRHHPPVSLLQRECTEDFNIPNTGHILRKGQMIIIPILGLHFDPEYFEEPEKFKPQRFAEDAKQNIPSGAYIPFGDGPRRCLGMRFGLMQVKLALVVLLRNFRFSIHEKTQLPVTVDPVCFIRYVKGGLWLQGHKIN